MKCACGCGRETSIATRTHTKYGIVKGQPRRFVIGHSATRPYRSPENKKAYFREWKREFRRKVIAHYGGKCACCGESNIEFLAIDHEAGGGEKHRKALGMRGGAAFYTWLKSQGFPSGYRVLCFNCNQSIGAYGYCPHEISNAEYPMQVLARKDKYK